MGFSLQYQHFNSPFMPLLDIVLMACAPCRFIPQYNAQTEEAELLRGSEADVSDNRLPEQELAELGQKHCAHSFHTLHALS